MIHLVLAVALSISNPSQYNYSKIAQTNSLAGIGMGTTHRQNEQLRYEDKAFLIEALSERANVHARSRVTNIVDRTIDVQLIDEKYLAAFSYYGSYFDCPYWGYLAPSVSSSKTYFRASNYEAHPTSVNREGYGWIDIFDSVPFYEPNFTNTYPILISGEPILASDICKIYGDVNSINKYAQVRGGRSIGCDSGTLEIDRDDYYGKDSILYYSRSEGGFIYDSDTFNTKTNILSSYDGSIYRKFRVAKHKDIGFDSVEGEMRAVTPITESYFMKDESTYRTPRSSVYLTTSSCGVAIKPFQTLNSVSVYCLYSFTHSFAGVTTSGYFFDKLPTSVVGRDRFVILIGGPKEETTISHACSVFSVANYRSLDDLRQDVPSPENPSTNYDEYIQTYSDETFYCTIGVVRFYCIFDITFNARTL